MKVIGYACIDNFAQQPRNLSLAHQVKHIEDFVREKGWDLTEVVQEEIHSGSGAKQEKLVDLLNSFGDVECDVLVVARLDRLTRNIRRLNSIVLSMVEKSGVGLISLEEELDSTTESGKLALHIIDIFTKWDNKRISDRTREIIASKRAKGERVGHAPYGYTYKNKKLVAVKKELETVALILQQREKGLSYHKIAKHLNDRKIASKRGGIWYAETVKTVFQNSGKDPSKS